MVRDETSDRSPMFEDQQASVRGSLWIGRRHCWLALDVQHSLIGAVVLPPKSDLLMRVYAYCARQRVARNPYPQTLLRPAHRNLVDPEVFADGVFPDGVAVRLVDPLTRNIVAESARTARHPKAPGAATTVTVDEAVALLGSAKSASADDELDARKLLTYPVLIDPHDLISVAWYEAFAQACALEPEDLQRCPPDHGARFITATLTAEKASEAADANAHAVALDHLWTPDNATALAGHAGRWTSHLTRGLRPANATPPWPRPWSSSKASSNCQLQQVAHSDEQSSMVRNDRDWTLPFSAQRATMRGSVAAVALGEPYESISLPIRAPSAGDLAARFGEAQDWTARWERAAGKTLRIQYGDIGGRRVGVNRIPQRVWVDAAEQLWRHLGVQREVSTYLDLVRRTEPRAPELLPWMRSRPHKALELRAVWDLLVRTVVWIDRTAGAASLYLRQVDVAGVDTKFVQRHRAVLSILLDLRLDPSRIDAAAPSTDFVGRYGFRRKPSYVRFRVLDPTSGDGFSEMTVRAEELAHTPLIQRRIFAVENEITYLAFPDVADAAIIFGGGYAVSALTPLTWLADRDLVYWGDLDTHGFAILDLLRRQFPATRSMLMDRQTLFTHESQWVTEPSQSLGSLDHLSPSEQRVHADLVDHTFGTAVRLEQELVQFSAVERALSELPTR